MIRAALCIFALVGLAGCGNSSAVEPQTRTVTVTSTPTAAADPASGEDPRCVEARAAVASELERFWTENVAAKESYMVFNMAMDSMIDLANLTKNQLSTPGCVNGQYANFLDSLSQVDQDSPLFDQQKAQVLTNLQVMQ